MFSNTLYLFKTEYINVTNLFQYCLYKSIPNLYKPCTPKLSDCYLYAEVGGLVWEISSTGVGRNWKSQDVRALINNALKSNHPVVAGNFNFKELQSLKNNIEDNCIIISYTYDEKLYDFLLDHFARTHIYKQNMGELEITAYDREIRNTQRNLVEHYKQVFDQQNSIPKKILPMGDYSVPIIDFFSLENFKKHFKRLDVEFSAEALEYYTTWHTAWKKIYGEFNENK